MKLSTLEQATQLAGRIEGLQLTLTSVENVTGFLSRNGFYNAVQPVTAERIKALVRADLQTQLAKLGADFAAL